MALVEFIIGGKSIIDEERPIISLHAQSVWRSLMMSDLLRYVTERLHFMLFIAFSLSEGTA